jgi:ribose transport system ATP-binding protein
MSEEAGRGCGEAALLCARGVGKRFAGVVILDGVNFDLRAGEVHALVGENGAGKSTLMKILSGVQTGYSGEIHVAGEPARFGSVREAEGAGVAIIH